MSGVTTGATTGPITLARRDTRVVELMDDPACDLRLLRRTYRQFALVNRMVAGWRRLYVGTLRPLLAVQPEPSLLDIGFGGGDIPRNLASWARRDGIDLAVTAIDPDPRAAAYVADLPPWDGVEFRSASSAELVAEGRQFDVVVSNHLLHHLDPVSLQVLLGDSEQLARHLVLHNDLQRSAVAYRAYGLLTRPLAGSSFLHTDGLRSIRRSYRPAELAGVREGWSVLPLGPIRLLLRFQRGAQA